MKNLILKFIYYIPLFAFSVIYKLIYKQKNRKTNNSSFKKVKPQIYDYKFFKRDD